MLRRLRQIGQASLVILATLGRAGVIWAQSLWTKPDLSNSAPLVIQQIYQIGVLSVVITVLSGFSIGAVLALQGYTQLVRYGSESALGLGVAMVLVMEIGPVVSALLFAGRAGSAMTAEIGLMKATEQLASMEMIGVDSLHRIVAPRLWAGFISMPILALMFSVVGIWGASLVGVDWLGVYEGAFWSVMQEGVDFNNHVLKGIVKTFVFGLVVTWIAVFEGYDTVPTSEGIASATTKTVVYSFVAILVLDFFLTLVMFGF
jgi:phospholipid/cholesterol/gamma-HCH transport system permease protein|tara:strand:+ start:434 stop:1213 length:780 start_codon:yes stop_codon:yes gene_type:complete